MLAVVEKTEPFWYLAKLYSYCASFFNFMGLSIIEIGHFSKVMRLLKITQKAK